MQTVGALRLMFTDRCDDDRDRPLGIEIDEPLAIVSSLQDNPQEAVAFALAHSIFELRFGTDIAIELAHADAVASRLDRLGYKIVRNDRPLE